MALNWNDIEKFESRYLQNEKHSEKMQRLLDGIKRVRQNNVSLDRAISFFEKLSESESIQMFYFGGFLRDAYLGLKPRDIDCVVNNGWERFESATRTFLIRKNRFGGLKLNIYGTEADVWRAAYTDVFKRGVVAPPTINHLPETTVFNCESIVLEVWAPEERYWGWENGFFEGCETRTLEVQNHWNHDFQEEYAALQLARIAKLQSKLGWKIGPVLKSYLRRHIDIADPSDIKRAYESHYGESCIPSEIIKHLKSLC